MMRNLMIFRGWYGIASDWVLLYFAFCLKIVHSVFLFFFEDVGYLVAESINFFNRLSKWGTYCKHEVVQEET